MEWPIYKKNLLILGNPESPVGICTLWTERERIAKGINPDSYCAIGNLYSGERGLDFLVRNLLANPKICYLIICGSDRSGSGEALIDFFTNGFTQGTDKQRDCWLVKGPNRGRVDIEVSELALEDLRMGVEVFDLRGVADPAQIERFIKENTVGGRVFPWGIPRTFLKKEPKADIFPAESSVQVVRGRTVAECWVKILRAIMLFGVVSHTHYESRQREILNLVTVVSGEDPDDPFIPKWMPFNKRHLEDYYPKLLTAIELPDASYTYGHRMRSYFGHDQLREVIEKLRGEPDSRRAVIMLWDPQKDYACKSSPCLNHIWVRHREGKLYVTAVIRSNDMFGGWPENTFGLRKLQQFIATEIGNCHLGDLVILSQSAHLYDDCWEPAKIIAETHWQEVVEGPHKQRDARGNFVISIEGGEVVVQHCSPEGEEVQVFRGKNIGGLMCQMAVFVSEIEHALYLGVELQKAKIALELGILYVQDQPLKL